MGDYPIETWDSQKVIEELIYATKHLAKHSLSDKTRFEKALLEIERRIGITKHLIIDF